MRDKKDNATIDLPGFEPAEPLDTAAAVPHALQPAVQAAVQPASRLASQLASQPTPETIRAPRPRRTALKQEQLQLLDLADTDVTGLPVWKHDPNLDLTGLPIWQPSN